MNNKTPRKEYRIKGVAKEHPVNKEFNNYMKKQNNPQKIEENKESHEKILQNYKRNKNKSVVNTTKSQMIEAWYCEKCGRIESYDSEDWLINCYFCAKAGKINRMKKIKLIRFDDVKPLLDKLKLPCVYDCNRGPGGLECNVCRINQGIDKCIQELKKLGGEKG